MDYNVILIRYAEIGLKSVQVRKKIEQILKKNIHFKLKRKNVEFKIKVLPARGRLFIYTSEINKSCKSLAKVFGVASFSPAIECSSNLQDIISTALELAKKKIKPNDTFAIRTRRSGSHSFSSKEISERVGAKVLDHFGRNRIKVNLTKPKRIIYIEVRDQFAYIFDKKYTGLGGFPYRTQNKLLSIIHNEYSLISTWLMLRKGCEIIPIFILEEGMTKKTKNIINQFINSLKKYLSIRKWAFYFIELNKTEKKESVLPFIFNYIIQTENALGLITSDHAFNNKNDDILKILELNKYLDVPIYRPLLFLNTNQLKDFKSKIPLKIELKPPIIPKFKNIAFNENISEVKILNSELEVIVGKKII
ncbi:MAG: THUMP domain-containing protein [Candidatus Helarchaeota archaeon]